LLELIVVIAIILFLSTMYFGSGPGGGQSSRFAACQRNLEAIHVAMKLYAADHNGAYPVVTNATTSEAPLSRLVPRYTAVTEIFICPSSHHPRLPEAASFEKRKISYAYWMGRTANDGGDRPLLSDALVDARPKLVGQQVFSSNGRRPGNNHRRSGGNILFCDGQVQQSSTNAAVALDVPPGVVLLNPRSTP
jgi:prepilin-type processing-associated H-X9-DG protein